MKSVLSYPGVMAEVQQIALALDERNALETVATTFVWRPDSMMGKGLSKIPMGLARRLETQLNRRAFTTIPRSRLACYPTGEIVRTASSLLRNDPILTDRIWDTMSRHFDKKVSTDLVPRAQIVQAYEYTALESFRAAGRLGVARVLHLPSLDSAAFEAIKRSERDQWPELRDPTDVYFDAKFVERYARRKEEIDLADVIITNSSLTARSHIAAGADPDKVVVVPLAAPPPHHAGLDAGTRSDGVLRVMWAGAFSIRKGAQYVLGAWARLPIHARLDVYGRMVLPRSVPVTTGENVVFHGSVPQSQLFEAYRKADVLLFPTLSDGFGMVVTEALAHGVPVITTTEAGAADLITPQNGRIIQAGSASAIVDAMTWCLDNRAQLSEMRKAAIETAINRQWSHYRADVVNSLAAALRRRGFAVSW